MPRLCAKCLLKLKRLVSIWRIISETCCCLERLVFSIIDATRAVRSEERFSRNAETDIVCRLLLEKKKKDAKPTLQVLVNRAAKTTLERLADKNIEEQKL